MNKKLLSVLLVISLLLSTIPVFADGTYSVDNSVVGKAKNPLKVSYSNDSLKYVSLGDSIAYGYGLDEKLTLKGLIDAVNKSTLEPNAIYDYAHNSYQYLVPGSYPDLIQKHFNCANDNYLQASIVGSRLDDLLTYIDDEKYPGDDFYNTLLYSFFIGSDAANKNVGDAVKKADLITITAGGNNFLCYPLTTISSWIKNGDLNKYYSKTAVSSFDSFKRTLLAEAALLDKLAKKEGEETYVSKVTSIINILQSFMYTIAAYNQNCDNVLDLIHEMNPDAVVAFTGIPGVLCEYDIKIGNMVIDLDKVFKPLYTDINNKIKNAAEQRSSYVRYIDIYDVDMFDIPNVSGYTLTIDQLKSLFNFDFSGEVAEDTYNALLIVHPSEKGHKQIADRILSNFKFTNKSSKFVTVINYIKNIIPTAMSKMGISKLGNFLNFLKTLNPLGLISFDLFSILK